MVIFNYATCHNFEPSLTIIIDYVHQYLKKKVVFRSINVHGDMCQILMDGLKLVTSMWCYGYNCNGIA